jgi:hypothetical protein
LRKNIVLGNMQMGKWANGQMGKYSFLKMVSRSGYV